MDVRTARAADVEAVRALLLECRLPVDGVPDELELLLVAGEGDRIVGVAGLELHDGDGLVRSVAVAPYARGRRVASRLCADMEQRARVFGARRLFLLTETAEAFFSKRGYRTIDRAAAPAAITASREFAAICPASAVLMVRESA